jgi:hypothetical protein
LTGAEESELLRAAKRLRDAQAEAQQALAARDQLIGELVESGARIVDISDVLSLTRKAVTDAVARAREQ